MPKRFSRKNNRIKRPEDDLLSRSNKKGNPSGKNVQKSQSPRAADVINDVSRGAPLGKLSGEQKRKQLKDNFSKFTPRSEQVSSRRSVAPSAVIDSIVDEPVDNEIFSQSEEGIAFAKTSNEHESAAIRKRQALLEARTGGITNPALIASITRDIDKEVEDDVIRGQRRNKEVLERQTKLFEARKRKEKRELRANKLKDAETRRKEELFQEREEGVARIQEEFTDEEGNTISRQKAENIFNQRQKFDAKDEEKAKMGRQLDAILEDGEVTEAEFGELVGLNDGNLNDSYKAFESRVGKAEASRLKEQYLKARGFDQQSIDADRFTDALSDIYNGEATGQEGMMQLDKAIKEMDKSGYSKEFMAGHLKRITEDEDVDSFVQGVAEALLLDMTPKEEFKIQSFGDQLVRINEATGETQVLLQKQSDVTASKLEGRFLAGLMTPAEEAQYKKNKKELDKLEPEQADPDFEFKLSKDFNTQSKVYLDVKNAYQRIVASAKDPSAAGDLALIFNYMKMLDPGSVVRESEFATAQNAGSVPERIRAKYNSILNGEKLDVNQRDDFTSRAEDLFYEQVKNQSIRQGQYKEQAERWNADPELFRDLLEDPLVDPIRERVEYELEGKLKFNGVDVEYEQFKEAESMYDGFTNLSEQEQLEWFESADPIQQQLVDEMYARNRDKKKSNPPVSDVSGISDFSRVNTAMGSGTATGIENGSSAWSKGYDLVLDGGLGAEVKSPFSGEIIDVVSGFPSPGNGAVKGGKGHNDGWGNQVKIRLDSGEEFWISHLADVDNLSKGGRINAGDRIGTQGNSGNTLGKTGVHLDLTIKKPDGTYLSSRDVASRLNTTKS